MKFPSGISTVTRPVVPFSGLIVGGLESGRLILITCEHLGYHTLDRVQNRFAVNFTSGSASGSDILLHINGRPDTQVPSVVFNSYLQNAWGKEEILYQYPMKQDQPFLLAIYIEHAGFKIGFNGIHAYSYEHRLDYKQANTLQIYGNVAVHSIQYVKNGLPLPAAPPATRVEIPEPAFLKYFIKQDSCIRIPENTIKADKVIYISGFPEHQCDSFSINLQTNEDVNSDIIFHLILRLPSKSVVCNSQLSGKWAAEKNVSNCFCFEPNINFDCHILCEDNKLRVALNSEHFFTFQIRKNQSLDQIKCIKFVGNCAINELRIN